MLEQPCTIPFRSTYTSIHCTVPLIDLLEGVTVTQDKARARGELGRWEPGPKLPLCDEGRCDPSSPDGDKLLASCQLHRSTHLHMLETEGRRSIATDRTRKHDTNSHEHSQTLSHQTPLAAAGQALTVFGCFFPRKSLLLLQYVQTHKCFVHR